MRPRLTPDPVVGQRSEAFELGINVVQNRGGIWDLISVVTGANYRGGGKGIAIALGEAGATVVSRISVADTTLSMAH